MGCWVWSGSRGSGAATSRVLEEEMLATTAFCTTCQRTVHLGRDDDGCPVCSTPLVRQEEAIDAGGRLDRGAVEPAI